MADVAEYFEKDGRRFDARAQVTIPLRYPVTVDGGVTSEVTLRRPKLKDNLRAEKIQGTPLEKGVWMLSTLSDVPQEILRELDVVDLNALEAQFESFTEGTPIPTN